MLRIFNLLFYYLIMIGLQSQYISLETGILLYGIQCVLSEMGLALSVVPLLNFFMRICDSDVEGSYIAILT